MNYLGAITGSSGAFNNQQTGASGVGAAWIIPTSVKSIYLQPSASGLQFETFRATGATGSTYNTTPARGAYIGAANVLAGPFRVAGDCHTVVSIWNAAGGVLNVRVFAATTS